MKENERKSMKIKVSSYDEKCIFYRNDCQKPELPGPGAR